MARVTRATTPDGLPVRLAADGFAEDAVYAYWDGSGAETGPRRIAEGRAAIADALAREGDVRLVPRICLHDGRSCFVEGDHVTPEGARVATFCWSAQLDAAGLLTRVLAQHCRPVEPSPTWRSSPPERGDDAGPVLDRYFGHLHAERFPEAVACFSPDVVYDHPPYAPGGPRVVFRGREALLDGFTRVRPRSAVRQVTLSRLQAGRDCFVEGVAEGIPDGGSFVSSLSLDADGLIERYIAFYTVSRIARRP